MDNRQSRAASAVSERREKAYRSSLARRASSTAVKDWVGHLEMKIQAGRAMPKDGRMTKPKWLPATAAISARSLAVLICDAVLRPRRDDEDLIDWTTRRPPTCQAVAGDIGAALKLPGGDRRERKALRETVGMELLNIAFHAGLIAELQSGKKGLAAACVLTAAAQEHLADIYTEIVMSGDLLAEQPVFKRPAPEIDLRANWRGWEEAPANDAPDVVTAFDAMQSVAWRVNECMLAHVLGNKDPAAQVRKAVTDLAAVKAKTKGWKNLSLRRQMALRKALKAAEESLRRWVTVLQATALKGKVFYYRARFDFRGRLYQLGGRLQYTSGDDLARSLLEFAEGRPLDAVGRAALANYADSLKPDKDPYRRQAALYALNSPVCRFPAALDCTQSGLQIYALLMRDADLGAKVNVYRVEPEPLDEGAPPPPPGDIKKFLRAFGKLAAKSKGLSPVQDFYQLVADDVAIPDIGRDIIKALGNPQIYGAGLNHQVKTLALLLERPQNDKTVRKHARTIREAIFRLAPGFRILSAWLRGCAALAAAQNLPLRWTHADGFEILQDSRRLVKGRDRFYLPGHERSIDYGTKKPTDVIDTHAQERAIAANYVHSCDGAYLREILRCATGARLGAVAVAHDSFACHPNELPRLHSLMVRRLDAIYSKSLLVKLWHEFEAQGIFGLPATHTPWMSEGFSLGEVAT
jgi:hypothetical protein